MPMDPTGTALAAVINAEMAAANVPPLTDPIAAKIRLALAAAIVKYIQANATVSGPVVVASVSAVTSGPAISGPGAGVLTAGVIS